MESIAEADISEKKGIDSVLFFLERADGFVGGEGGLAGIRTQIEKAARYEGTEEGKVVVYSKLRLKAEEIEEEMAKISYNRLQKAVKVAKQGDPDQAEIMEEHLDRVYYWSPFHLSPEIGQAIYRIFEDNKEDEAGVA